MLYLLTGPRTQVHAVGGMGHIGVGAIPSLRYVYVGAPAMLLSGSGNLPIPLHSPDRVSPLGQSLPWAARSLVRFVLDVDACEARRPHSACKQA